MHHLMKQLHADLAAKGGHMEVVRSVLSHVPVFLGEALTIELPEV